MTRVPQRTTAVAVYMTSTFCTLKDGRQAPARGAPYPCGLLGDLATRFQLAWAVFWGRYDALDYEDNP